MNGREAGAYTVGGTILWGALVELGLAEFVRVNGLGLAGLILRVGGIEAALVRGLGTFLAALVEEGLGGIPLAVSTAWDGTAAEGLGPFAPVLIGAQVVAVSAFVVWGWRSV